MRTTTNHITIIWDLHNDSKVTGPWGDNIIAVMNNMDDNWMFDCKFVTTNHDRAVLCISHGMITA